MTSACDQWRYSVTMAATFLSSVMGAPELGTTEAQRHREEKTERKERKTDQYAPYFSVLGISSLCLCVSVVHLFCGTSLNRFDATTSVPSSVLRTTSEETPSILSRMAKPFSGPSTAGTLV